MSRYFAGVITGLVLGTAFGAYAAKVVGYDGYLSGWSVMKDGEEICSEPFIYLGSREIECD
jgi:hypothetical protein